MKSFSRFKTYVIVSIAAISFASIGIPVFADQSPAGCTGSALNIFLFSSASQAHVGDTVSFSVTVFNGTGSGPIACDATDITASIVTPDAVNHPIVLTRTALSNGNTDVYTNVVTYVIRPQDLVAGMLTVTASDTGVIHQNDTNSQGGGNQGVNITVTPIVSIATLHVIKVVSNTHGGTAIPSDFMIHVENTGADVSGSPAIGASSPGTSYSLAANTYVVSENATTSYTSAFSGDCDAGGSVVLANGDAKICTVTNSDVATSSVPTLPTPPVITFIPSGGGGGGGFTSATIGISKVPTPTALPLGPGSVTYNYVVWNVAGSVALANVTVVDDKCSAMKFVSGDTNSNGKLDLTEKWNYVCTSTLSVTTTNTVTVTGYSDDSYHRSTIASAVATVVVGGAAPVVGISNTPLNPMTTIIPLVPAVSSLSVVPNLPNTGLSPDSYQTLWYSVAIVGGVLALAVYLRLLKRFVS